MASSGKKARGGRRGQESSDEFWQLITDCSATFFQKITTLSAQQRCEWEDRYEIPCGRGRKGINLQEVFRSIRKLIADHRLVLNSKDGSSSLARAKTEKEVEKLDEQIKKIRSQTYETDKRYARVDVLHQRMTRLAGILRNLGDGIARKRQITGEDAQAMINNAIGNFERELDRMVD